MGMIDHRGRLFGRWNVIDAAVAAVFLGLIPLAFGALLLFRSSVPTVSALTPSEIIEGREATVRVTGKDLRAYLKATLNTRPATFLTETTTAGELRVPPLSAGTYDLVLLDEASEVTRKTGALRVVPTPIRTATLRVRFAAMPEVARAVRTGEMDASNGGTDARTALTDITDEGMARGAMLNVRGSLGTLLEREIGSPIQFEQNVAVFTATVRIPVKQTPSGWRFRDKPVKVGEPFTFESAAGVLDGWIVDVHVAE